MVQPGHSCQAARQPAGWQAGPVGHRHDEIADYWNRYAQACDDEPDHGHEHGGGEKFSVDRLGRDIHADAFLPAPLEVIS